MKYKHLKISELNFNKSEIDKIRDCQFHLYENSARAQAMLYMNILNIALGFFYHNFFDVQHNLVIYLHGAIFFLILRKYYFYKSFCYYHIKEYLVVIEKFLKRKKVVFEEGYYLDSFNAHGGLSITADRLMISNDIDQALKNISKQKKWKHIFELPKIIDLIKG